MNPEKEFDSLVALWAFIADQYSEGRDPVLLRCLPDIEKSCDELRHRLDQVPP
jgi:hypothetical protein